MLWLLSIAYYRLHLVKDIVKLIRRNVYALAIHVLLYTHIMIAA